MKSRWTALFGGWGTIVLASAAWGAVTWDGEGKDNEFSTRANWSSHKPFDAKEIYEIKNAGKVERMKDSQIGALTISGTTFELKRGVHSNGRSGRKVRDKYFHGRGGVVTQSGGKYSIGHMLSIGSGDSSQGGVYKLAGGELIIFRDSSTLMKQSDQTPAAASLEIGDNANANTANFEISGKASLATRANVTIASNGVFSVEGSRVSVGIGSHNSIDGGWTQLEGGTLKFAIDSRGAGPVFIDDVDDTRGVKVDFKAGSKLQLGFAPGTTPQAGTWVVFEAENTVFDETTLAGLSLTNTTGAGWSFGYDNIKRNGVITVSYVEVVVEEPY